MGIAESSDGRVGTDQVQVVAGQGASVNGVNDLGDELHVAVSPVGEIVVGDWKNGRLVSFENGVGKVLTHSGATTSWRRVATRSCQRRPTRRAAVCTRLGF